MQFGFLMPQNTPTTISSAYSTLYNFPRMGQKLFPLPLTKGSPSILHINCKTFGMFFEFKRAKTTARVEAMPKLKYGPGSTTLH